MKSMLTKRKKHKGVNKMTRMKQNNETQNELKQNETKEHEAKQSQTKRNLHCPIGSTAEVSNRSPG